MRGRARSLVRGLITDGAGGYGVWAHPLMLRGGGGGLCVDVVFECGFCYFAIILG